MVGLKCVRFVAVIAACYVNIGIAQVNPDEYLTIVEVSEKAGKLYQNEEYDKAYLLFQSVNYNDTAYFDAKLSAMQCASSLDHYDTVIKICKEVLAVDKYNSIKGTFVNSLGHALIQ